MNRPCPANYYMFKVNEALKNGVYICSKLIIKTPERRHWHWEQNIKNNTLRNSNNSTMKTITQYLYGNSSSVFIVDLEQVFSHWDRFHHNNESNYENF